jgi:hypothetical protein
MNMTGAKQLLSAAVLVAVSLLLAATASAQAGQVTLAGAVPIAAGDVTQGTTDHPLVTFSLTFTAVGRAGGTTTFTGLTFNELGTRVAGDYTRYILYEGNATTGLNFVAESTTTTFSGFSQTLSSGVQRFYGIMVDVTAGATPGNTFQAQVTAAGVTTGVSVIGANQTGGVQTIVAASGVTMEVQRGSNPVIPSGLSSNDDLGDVNVAGQTFIYTIRNTSASDNLVLDADPVAANPVNNVTVNVTQPATLTLAPNETTTFSLEVIPGGTGPFLFGVSIDNNSNNDPYVYTVSGDGVQSTVTQLVIVTQPGNGTGGTTLSQTPVVEARDAGNNVVTAFNGPVTASIGAGGAMGAQVLNATVNASNGVASFTTLAIDLAGADYQLEFTDGNVNSALSATFDITVGPVAQLEIATQPPALASGGEIWAAQPSLRTLDAGGNHVTTDNTTAVDVALIGGNTNATLLGTLSATAAGGNIDFTDLGIDLIGTGYQLEFSATIGSNPVVLTSTAIDIELGAPAALVVAQQPAGAAAGATFATPAIVNVVDAGGNVVTTDNATSIAVSLTGGDPSAVLDGTSPVTVSGGVAEFTDLEIDLPGTGYVLEFTSTAGNVDSDPFSVAGVPTMLGIRTQPGRAAAGVAMLDVPEVEVQDSTGALVGNDNTTEIEVTIETGTGALIGTATVQVVNGVATFTGLGIEDAQLGVVLRFSDVTNTPALTHVDSDPFHVVGAADEIVIVTQPSNAQPGTTFPNAVVLEVRDANGLLVFNDNATEVDASIATGTGEPGALLSGTLGQTAVDGVITFDDLSIDLEGAGYRLLFEVVGGGLADVESDEFDISPSATGGGGGSKKSDGCSTGEGISLTLLLVLLALAATGVARRRTA